MNWDAFVQILVLFAVGFLIFSKLISAFAIKQEREKSARIPALLPCSSVPVHVFAFHLPQFCWCLSTCCSPLSLLNPFALILVMPLLLVLVGFKGSAGLVLLPWVTGVAPLSSLLLLSGMFFLPCFSSAAPCHSHMSVQQATSPREAFPECFPESPPHPHTLVPFSLITIKLLGFLPEHMSEPLLWKLLPLLL